MDNQIFCHALKRLFCFEAFLPSHKRAEEIKIAYKKYSHSVAKRENFLNVTYELLTPDYGVRDLLEC